MDIRQNPLIEDCPYQTLMNAAAVMEFVTICYVDGKPNLTARHGALGLVRVLEAAQGAVECQATPTFTR